MAIKNLDIILKEFTKKCKEKFGENLVSIILFGSQARGTASKYSDIDLLIITNKKLSIKEGDYIYAIASDISLKYDVVISCFSYSNKDFKTKNSPFLLNVRREGIKI